LSISSVPLLLVDDEPNGLLVHGMVLEKAGYAVAAAANAAQALHLAARTDFHVALVNHPLSGSSTEGLELLAQLRDVHPLTVSMLMTVCEGTLIGFRTAQAGAFDFLTKPLPGEALLAAVRTALAERSRREQAYQSLRVGDLVVDLVARRVYIAGDPVPLTKREFVIMAYMVFDPGRIFSYEDLWRVRWGRNSQLNKQIIRKTFSRLREKVGRKRIVCVRKEGYALVPVRSF
jgi:DNA-binding response OmpR family regulator